MPAPMKTISCLRSPYAESKSKSDRITLRWAGSVGQSLSGTKAHLQFADIVRTDIIPTCEVPFATLGRISSLAAPRSIGAKNAGLDTNLWSIQGRPRPQKGCADMKFLSQDHKTLESVAILLVAEIHSGLGRKSAELSLRILLVDVDEGRDLKTPGKKGFLPIALISDVKMLASMRPVEGRCMRVAHPHKTFRAQYSLYWTVPFSLLSTIQSRIICHRQPLQY